jgi:hypothetical protein
MLVSGRPARFCVGALLLLVAPAAGLALEIPSWLPRYDLDIRLETDRHQALVRERVTWTNRHACQVSEIQFNVHSYFKVANKDVGFLAKMEEVLRMAPSEGMDFEGHACQIHKVSLVSQTAPPSGSAARVRGQMGTGPERIPPPRESANGRPISIQAYYRDDIPTALVVPLPRPLGPKESVTLELEFVMRLPAKQGRWGQWNGITFLNQWLPVVAFHDEKGWQPAPFIPWHLPYFNEAGIYTARITLPACQKLGCSAPVLETRDLGDGTVQVVLEPNVVRDFSVYCCEKYQEYSEQCGRVKVRCLAFPEHEHYARLLVHWACEALPVYCKWFGPFPYKEFTIVESYFGWNGNQSGALVMIDARVFQMPHLAAGFVDNLITHELCHEWWYNVVGNNGYAETFMSEAMASYLSHRLNDCKSGKNNAMLQYPAGLGWLPNIYREDYRNYGLCGALARGDNCPAVQDMPKFGHLPNLSAMTYDKGSRIIGTIEQRLGEAAFFDFLHRVYARYYFRVLRVADFQRELEEFTGSSWEQFFKDWIYGCGVTDWCLEKVILQRCPKPGVRSQESGVRDQEAGARSQESGVGDHGAYQATIFVKQKGEITEQTVLGICLDGKDSYPIRIPIVPGVPEIKIDDPPATVTCLPDNRIRVDVILPSKPTQIVVDPDQVLPDKNPRNNCWRPRARLRITPLYTLLDDTDVTNRYDRWNFTIGPWLYGGGYSDPWFTRSEMLGLRASAYRTQDFYGGGYLAYRTDDQNVVAGVDALWDHCPWPHTQVGLVAERSLTQWGDHGGTYDRGVIYGRYVWKYGSSLYLPPIEYTEVFGAIQDFPLPVPDQIIPGTDRFNHQTTAGIHYHLDYLTPYWDPEGGFRLDATYQTGIPILGESQAFNQVFGQVSYVKSLPELPAPEALAPVTQWLAQTRLALRAFGAVGLPDKGDYFTLGGGQLFRGYDQKQRQGSLVWVGSVEWRVPLAKGLNWDCLDHVVGLRNVYAAGFYDAGNAYVLGHQTGNTAHALGAGLRLDVAWFGLIERTTLRFDAAKTINDSSPWQFWFGIQHPF